jgi:hypothetical protein
VARGRGTAWPATRDPGGGRGAREGGLLGGVGRLVEGSPDSGAPTPGGLGWGMKCPGVGAGPSTGAGPYSETLGRGLEMGRSPEGKSSGWERVRGSPGLASQTVGASRWWAGTGNLEQGAFPWLGRRAWGRDLKSGAWP